MPARAKLNLDLEVMQRRGDGFHDLRTTFQAIDLHDLLFVTRSPTGSFETSGMPLRVSEKDNTVLRAQKALEEAAGKELPVAIHLHKRIPPGSGLGGASSDAAATMRVVKTVYGLDVDLRPIARQLGADVTFFLTGGRARAEDRGEDLAPVEKGPGSTWFAVAWPGFELSTAAVYGEWDEVGGDGPNHLRRAAEHLEPRLQGFAQSLGPGWQMTGSGSAFFKRCETAAEARNSTRRLATWSAVTQAVGPWA